MGPNGQVSKFIVQKIRISKWPISFSHLLIPASVTPQVVVRTLCVILALKSKNWVVRKLRFLITVFLNVSILIMDQKIGKTSSLLRILWAKLSNIKNDFTELLISLGTWRLLLNYFSDQKVLVKQNNVGLLTNRLPVPISTKMFFGSIFLATNLETFMDILRLT